MSSVPTVARSCMRTASRMPDCTVAIEKELARLRSKILRAAELAGVPAVEVRAVSNEVDEPERARWRFDDALAALDQAIPRLLTELGA